MAAGGPGRNTANPVVTGRTLTLAGWAGVGVALALGAVVVALGLGVLLVLAPPSRW